MSAEVLPWPDVPKRFWLAEPIPGTAFDFKAHAYGLGSEQPLGIVARRSMIEQRIRETSVIHIGLPIIVRERSHGEAA